METVSKAFYKTTRLAKPFGKYEHFKKRKKNTMTLTLYMFISLISNGENIGTTDYVVYQKKNVLTIEVL